MPSRPWCCPEPKCTPIFQLKDSDYPDITVPTSGESWFCFGYMDRAVRFSYDGVEHKNDLNSCTYTVLKGVIRFQENEDDWEGLAIAYRRAFEKLQDIKAAITTAVRDAEGWVLFNAFGEPLDWPKGWPAEIDRAFLDREGIRIAP